MSNGSVPDAAAIFQSLEERNLSVISMIIEKDAQEAPLSARFTFKESAIGIPADLPATMISRNREIPVTYGVPKHD